VDVDRERGTRVLPVVTSSESDEEAIRSELIDVSVFGDVLGAVITGAADPGVARRKAATLVQQQTEYRVRLFLIHWPL
jgi:hypothetical protein